MKQVSSVQPNLDICYSFATKNMKKHYLFLLKEKNQKKKNDGGETFLPRVIHAFLSFSSQIERTVTEIRREDSKDNI